MSLADLGQTFFDMQFKSSGQKSHAFSKLKNPKKNIKDIINSHFKSNSIIKSLKGISRKKEGGHKILVETAWTDWRYGLSPTYLIIKDQYRAYLNKEIQIFNTLMNKEIVRLKKNQASELRWIPFVQIASILKIQRIGTTSRSRIRRAQLWL